MKDAQATSVEDARRAAQVARAVAELARPAGGRAREALRAVVHLFTAHRHSAAQADHKRVVRAAARWLHGQTGHPAAP
jgi:hypothetical protein